MPPAHPAAAVGGAGESGGVPSSTTPKTPVAVRSPVDARPFVEKSTPAPESQADGGFD